MTTNIAVRFTIMDGADLENLLNTARALFKLVVSRRFKVGMLEIDEAISIWPSQRPKNVKK
jgi:hypothetical protein